MSDRRPGKAASLSSAVLALVLLAGCALQPSGMEPSKALLTQLPSDVARRSPDPGPRAFALLVFAPRSRPLYDTVRMAYQVQAHQVDYFSRNEWAETPAQMLQPLLVRTLQETGSFGHVVTPPYVAPYGWGLRTEIEELIADFTTEPAVMRLTLRLQLTEGVSGRVVATHDVSVREPLQQRTPEGCIAAANVAAARALAEVARFVIEAAH